MKTSAPPSSSAYLRNLQSRIIAVRQKRAMVKMITGIASALGLLIGVITLEALLDEVVDLPWLARAFILLTTLAGSGFLLWRDSIKPFLKRPDDDAVALMVEHALPVFKTRFIASIQLSRAFAKETPPALVRALLAETSFTVLKTDFSTVVKTARLKRSILTGIAVAGVTATLAWYGGTASVLLLKRAFLFTIHLPRKTQILTVTGDQKIGIGEDCKIDVTASGVTPPKGKIISTTASGQVREFDLLSDPAQHAHYSAVVHTPQEAFTYHVELNDDRSDTYHVSTMQRPSVAQVDCEQIYPDYVKLPPVKRTVGDLTLLAGSHLRVVARASMPVKEATLRLAGINSEIKMRVDPKTGLNLYGEFEIPAKDLTGFSIHLVSTDGVESGETAIYRIDLVPDRAPVVVLLWPTRREELAVPTAKFLIAFEAKDDFGITKVDLHYTVDQGPEKTIPFPLDTTNHVETSLKRHFDWDLEKLPLAQGNVIEFWLTVTDTNTVTGPGIGATEHYQIRIVSSQEKLADIQNHRQEELEKLKEVEKSLQDSNEEIAKPLTEKPK